KRLADALADGDRIYAVIRGSAVNNDGAAKVGFTAPSVEGQAEAISESLMMAGVDPSTLGYVEGHGSGTPLGDPIEVAALTQAFRAAGAEGQGFCALGSVKTALGHCNTAAGAAGLIKAALALAHRTVPPSLHFESPNPQIDFAASPFYVPTEARPWERGEEPRRAGVSSFGLGGTNAHLVLEEAPAPEAGDEPARRDQLLVLSARTASALDAAAERLAERLEGSDLNLADAAWTLQTGRKAFEHRRIAVARDPEGAIAALRDRPVSGGAGRREGAGARPVVFLFPGLGDQRVDMARDLYETEPVFREQVDLCASRLAPLLGADLREVMFSSGPASPRAAGPDLRAMLRRNAAEEAPAEERLRQTVFAQPACFVVEYALARLLMSWGIEPQAMIGYSLGEYVAACLAGVLPLDAALDLVARRAKLIQDLPGGAMLAIPLPEAEVRPLLGEGLSLSATNGPHFCVAGGPAEAVEALDGLLAGRGVSCIRLRTTHAFHSSMMAPAVDAFTAIARGAEMGSPAIPYLSNVTGSWITADDLADPGYWARHMRSTVRFAEGIGELLQEPERVFLEVGPGATLSTLVKQHPAAAANRVAVPTLGGPDLLEAVGRLWIAGVEIDWARFHGGERRLRVPLPTYPFERQRYWIDPPTNPPAAPLRESDLADWFWVPGWKQVPRVAAPMGQGERWLLFLDETGFGERIAERLRSSGQEVFTARMESGLDYEALLQEARPGTILHLGGITGEEPSFEAAQEAGLVSLTRLTQAFAALGDASLVKLVLAADGLQEVLDGDPIHPAKSTVLGPLKVVHQELPRLACGSVDVVLPAPGSPQEERLIGQILAEAADPRPAVALRGRQRWERGFEPVRLAAETSLEGVWFIAGAAHGPGLRVAEHLVGAGARVGLTLPRDFQELALEREAGADRLLVFRDEEIGAALAETRARFGPVHGVYFAGGTAAGGLIQLKTPEALHAALDPLARSVQALFAAVDAEPDPPAFVVLSSTTTAMTGSLGQLEAAAEGSFLDALAAHRAAEGRPFTVAVHWDPYQWGGWLVGSASGMAPEDVAATLAAHAVGDERSAAALRRLLAAPLPRVIVSSRDLPGLIAETDSVTADTLLAQMAPAHTGEKTRRPAGLPTAYEAPRDELEERLAAIWEDLFGIEPIGRHDSFLELGGHSLLAIQMVTQIRSALEAELPVTALFEHPTVAALAQAVRRTRGEEDPAEIEALLALIEGLSPEEAAERLAEMGV
ncbi:MAG TPA: acyltransferase domain-containing protein, partial [Thermoanaerobaculia bacterium]|nr:acyltransferase domain-containing protein [Thermoanaerobaculia bacterium]